MRRVNKFDCCMPPPTVDVDTPKRCTAIFIIAVCDAIILIGDAMIGLAIGVFCAAIGVILLAIGVLFAGEAMFFVGDAMFRAAIAKRCAKIAILLVGGSVFALTRVKRNCLKMKGGGKRLPLVQPCQQLRCLTGCGDDLTGSADLFGSKRYFLYVKCNSLQIFIKAQN